MDDHAKRIQCYIIVNIAAKRLSPLAKRQTDSIFGSKAGRATYSVWKKVPTQLKSREMYSQNSTCRQIIIRRARLINSRFCFSLSGRSMPCLLGRRRSAPVLSNALSLLTRLDLARAFHSLCLLWPSPLPCYYKNGHIVGRFQRVPEITEGQLRRSK